MKVEQRKTNLGNLFKENSLDFSTMMNNGLLLMMPSQCFNTVHRQINNATYHLYLYEGQGTVSTQYISPGTAIPVLPRQFKRVFNDAEDEPTYNSMPTHPMMDRCVILKGGDLLQRDGSFKASGKDCAMNKDVDHMMKNEEDNEDEVIGGYGPHQVRNLCERVHGYFKDNHYAFCYPDGVNASLRLFDIDEEGIDSLIKRYFPDLYDKKDDYVLMLVGQPELMVAIGISELLRRDSSIAGSVGWSNSEMRRYKVYAAPRNAITSIDNSRLNCHVGTGEDERPLEAHMRFLYTGDNGFMFKKSGGFPQLVRTNSNLSCLPAFVSEAQLLFGVDRESDEAVFPRIVGDRAMSLLFSTYTMYGCIQPRKSTSAFIEQPDIYTLCKLKVLSCALSSTKVDESIDIPNVVNFIALMMSVHLQTETMSLEMYRSQHKDDWQSSSIGVQQESDKNPYNLLTMTDRACVLSSAANAVKNGLGEEEDMVLRRQKGVMFSQLLNMFDMNRSMFFAQDFCSAMDEVVSKDAKVTDEYKRQNTSKCNARIKPLPASLRFGFTPALVARLNCDPASVDWIVRRPMVDFVRKTLNENCSNDITFPTSARHMDAVYSADSWVKMMDGLQPNHNYNVDCVNCCHPILTKDDKSTKVAKICLCAMLGTVYASTSRCAAVSTIGVTSAYNQLSDIVKVKERTYIAYNFDANLRILEDKSKMGPYGTIILKHQDPDGFGLSRERESNMQKRTAFGKNLTTSRSVADAAGGTVAVDSALEQTTGEIAGGQSSLSATCVSSSAGLQTVVAGSSANVGCTTTSAGAAGVGSDGGSGVNMTAEESIRELARINREGIELSKLVEEIVIKFPTHLANELRCNLIGEDIKHIDLSQKQKETIEMVQLYREMMRRNYKVAMSSTDVLGGYQLDVDRAMKMTPLEINTERLTGMVTVLGLYKDQPSFVINAYIKRQEDDRNRLLEEERREEEELKSLPGNTINVDKDNDEDSAPGLASHELQTWVNSVTSAKKKRTASNKSKEGCQGENTGETKKPKKSNLESIIKFTAAIIHSSFHPLPPQNKRCLQDEYQEIMDIINAPQVDQRRDTLDNSTADTCGADAHSPRTSLQNQNRRKRTHAESNRKRTPEEKSQMCINTIKVVMREMLFGLHHETNNIAYSDECEQRSVFAQINRLYFKGLCSYVSNVNSYVCQRLNQKPEHMADVMLTKVEQKQKRTGYQMKAIIDPRSCFNPIQKVFEQNYAGIMTRAIAQAKKFNGDVQATTIEKNMLSNAIYKNEMETPVLHVVMANITSHFPKITKDVATGKVFYSVACGKKMADEHTHTSGYPPGSGTASHSVYLPINCNVYLNPFEYDDKTFGTGRHDASGAAIGTGGSGGDRVPTNVMNGMMRDENLYEDKNVKIFRPFPLLNSAADDLEEKKQNRDPLDAKGVSDVRELSELFDDLTKCNPRLFEAGSSTAYVSKRNCSELIRLLKKYIERRKRNTTNESYPLLTQWFTGIVMDISSAISASVENVMNDLAGGKKFKKICKDAVAALYHTEHQDIPIRMLIGSIASVPTYMKTLHTLLVGAELYGAYFGDQRANKLMEVDYDMAKVMVGLSLCLKTAKMNGGTVTELKQQRFLKMKPIKTVLVGKGMKEGSPPMSFTGFRLVDSPVTSQVCCNVTCGLQLTQSNKVRAVISSYKSFSRESVLSKMVGYSNRQPKEVMTIVKIPSVYNDAKIFDDHFNSKYEVIGQKISEGVDTLHAAIRDGQISLDALLEYGLERLGVTQADVMQHETDDLDTYLTDVVTEIGNHLFMDEPNRQIWSSLLNDSLVARLRNMEDSELALPQLECYTDSMDEEDY